MPSRSQVNAAIRRAKEMGLVHDSSDFRCLVTEAWWEKAGGKGGKRAPITASVHAHGDTREVSKVTGNDTRQVSQRHKRSVATSP